MRRIVGGFIGLVFLVFSLQIPEIYNSIAKFFKYFDDPKVVATFFTGFLAVSAVLFSQWRFDKRLEKQHQNDLAIKAEELALAKKEEVFLLCSEACVCVEKFTQIQKKLIDNVPKQGDSRSVEFNELLESGLVIASTMNSIIGKLEFLISCFFPKAMSDSIPVFKAYESYIHHISYMLQIGNDNSILIALIDDKELKKIKKTLTNSSIDFQSCIIKYDNIILEKL